MFKGIVFLNYQGFWSLWVPGFRKAVAELERCELRSGAKGWRPSKLFFGF